MGVDTGPGIDIHPLRDGLHRSPRTLNHIRRDATRALLAVAAARCCASVKPGESAQMTAQAGSAPHIPAHQPRLILRAGGSDPGRAPDPPEHGNVDEQRRITPAWKRVTAEEKKLPTALATAAAIGLQVVLPNQ
jgi:hypothetical protein